MTNPCFFSNLGAPYLKWLRLMGNQEFIWFNFLVSLLSEKNKEMYD